MKKGIQSICFFGFREVVNHMVDTERGKLLGK